MLWVIKIGGSLYDSKYLVEWLDILSSSTSHDIIIVPGGGPFADQVRVVDQQFNLDQALAHKMAVLAMQQYGNFLRSLCPKLCLASSKEQMQACWDQAKATIWEPYDMVFQYCDMEKSWEVTSDSLAAWLATFISADHLLYVKSAEIILSKVSIDELAVRNCIDSTLPKFIAEMNTSVHFMHKSQASEFINFS